MKLFWRLMGLIGIIFTVLSLPLIAHHYSERARLAALFDKCSREHLETTNLEAEARARASGKSSIPSDLEAEALKGLKVLNSDCFEVGLPCGSCSGNPYAHPELRPSWLDCLKARTLGCLDE